MLNALYTAINIFIHYKTTRMSFFVHEKNPSMSIIFNNGRRTLVPSVRASRRMYLPFEKEKKKEKGIGKKNHLVSCVHFPPSTPLNPSPSRALLHAHCIYVYTLTRVYKYIYIYCTYTRLGDRATGGEWWLWQCRPAGRRCSRGWTQGEGRVGSDAYERASRGWRAAGGGGEPWKIISAAAAAEKTETRKTVYYNVIRTHTQTHTPLSPPRATSRPALPLGTGVASAPTSGGKGFDNVLTR